MYRRILVPADGSRLTRRAKRQAAIPAREVLDRARRDAKAAGVESVAVAATSDSVYEAILRQAAKSRCDLIVMASHGRKGWSRVLLGSETAQLLVHARIPVLVVR